MEGGVDDYVHAAPTGANRQQLELVCIARVETYGAPFSTCDCL